MLQLIFDFFGIPYDIVWNEDVLIYILPVAIVFGMILVFYMFMCFMQFLAKLFKFRKE